MARPQLLFASKPLPRQAADPLRVAVTSANPLRRAALVMRLSVFGDLALNEVAEADDVRNVDLVIADDDLADSVMPHARSRVDLIEPLTPREQQVAQLLAGGLTNKEIAQRLGITEHTIKFHLNGLLRKLGVATRTEAVVQAARLGLLVL